MTDAEKDAALRYPGSVTAGMVLWLKMPDASDLNDYSGNGLNGTGTALAARGSDPPIYLEQPRIVIPRRTIISPAMMN